MKSPIRKIIPLSSSNSIFSHSSGKNSFLRFDLGPCTLDKEKKENAVFYGIHKKKEGKTRRICYNLIGIDPSGKAFLKSQKNILHFPYRKKKNRTERGINMIKIITDIGYCYGVKNAIDILKKAGRENRKVYLTHPLIHNKEENGKLMKENNAEIYTDQPLDKNDAILFSAHGHGKTEEQPFLDQARLYDATCPLILKRYERLKESIQDNTRYFFLGKKGHQETLGFLENFPFLEFIDVSMDIEHELQDRIDDSNDLVLIPQTTISMEKYQTAYHILSNTGRLRLALPICPLYSRRAEEAIGFLKSCNIDASAVFVLGDKSSSNAQELKKAIQDAYQGLEVHILTGLDGFDLETLRGKDIYLTSATSYPEENVIKVEKTLQDYFR